MKQGAVGRWIAVTAVALVAGVASIASAEQRLDAIAVPISDTLISLEVQAADGRWIRGMVQEGGMFKITEREAGTITGFVPILKEGDLVTVRVFDIKRHASGGEMLAFVEEVELLVNETGQLRKATEPYPVRITGIREPSGKAPHEKPVLKGVHDLGSKGPCSELELALFEEVLGGRCCLTCGGTESCGCSVSDSCGSCCTPPCCAV
jgi:hypothetical protein